jgi:hypothetical protein
MFAFRDVTKQGVTTRRWDRFCQDCRSKERSRQPTDPGSSRVLTPDAQDLRNARYRATSTANRILRDSHQADYEAFAREAEKEYPIPEGADTKKRQNIGALRARRVAAWMRYTYKSEYDDLYKAAKLYEQQTGV